MKEFESLFDKYMTDLCVQNPDPSHDILHVRRVVKLAKQLAQQSEAKLDVVIPAAYLHDCVYISKADNRRAQASRISAEHATKLLRDWNYPPQHLPDIEHAIAAHSFSANIRAETLEAKIVQDADRLDAMGAIGIFRCFAFSGLAKRPLYNFEDPFSDERELNDSENTLDHFYVKLLKLQERLNTEAAKVEGQVRLKTMEVYLESLRRELRLQMGSEKATLTETF